MLESGGEQKKSMLTFQRTPQRLQQCKKYSSLINTSIVTEIKM